MDHDWSKKLEEDRSRASWRAFTTAFDASPTSEEEVIANLESALATWPDYLRQVSLYLGYDEDDERDCRELPSTRFGRNLLLDGGSRWPAFLTEDHEAFAHFRRVTIDDGYSYHETIACLEALEHLEVLVITRPTLITTIDVLRHLPNLSHIALTDYCDISPSRGDLDVLGEVEGLESLVIFEHILEPNMEWKLPANALATLRSLWLPREQLLAQPPEAFESLEQLTLKLDDEDELAQFGEWLEQLDHQPARLSIETQDELTQRVGEVLGSIAPEAELRMFMSKDFGALWEQEISLMGESPIK